jgi:RNA polymerase sigma factor (sigma-70 family)
MTEPALVSGCMANDRTAQRQLYDRYKTAMFTLAYRLTSDFDDANDVLQDTFLEVFKNIAQFRQEATLGAWIKAILIRKAYHKRQKIRHFDLVEELPPEAASTNWYDENSNTEHLEAAILSLPEGFRTVFVLTEIEGYTHREVAQMLSISEGTSKSQLFYAKKKLREKLNRRDV